MSGFHSPISNKKDYNQKETNQINKPNSKEFILFQCISIFLTFCTSFFITQNTPLLITISYGIIAFNIISTIYKAIKLCPIFILKICYGLYPLLLIILITPIFSNYYIISWNPATLFKISIYQLTNITFYYFLSLQICIYYNDFYKLVYLFHFLFILIGCNYSFLNKLTTPKIQNMDNSYKVKGFYKNTFVSNENPNHYKLSNFESNFSELSESNFHYYKSKRINEKMKTKTQELDLFFIENIATCHNIISLNNKLIVQNENQIDIPLFESIGWKIYEPQNIIESEINYNDLISIFVRPKQEKDLQQKINAHLNIQQTEDDDDTTEEEENESLNDKKEEILMKEHYELGIIKKFNNVSTKNENSTVIVRDVNDSYYKVYSKGSIEKIVQCCKKETIPFELNEMINEYRNNDSYLVMGLSAKMVKMSYSQSQEVKRECLETNMIFLGVVIVEKKSK